MSTTIKGVKGHFSAINGSQVRHVYSEDGLQLPGLVTKLGVGRYRVKRFIDNKVCEKSTLRDAYKRVRRAN